MAQLWGGRFTKETDQKVFDFNESFSFDRRLFFVDIEGSLAHAKMLAAQGIITEEDGIKIREGLNSILEDYKSGKLVFSKGYEDVHSFVEANLIERIGEAGKKLHTGRSRNDQVALDMKLYARQKTTDIIDDLTVLEGTLLNIIKENTETYMPGFTHLQKAQPVTLAHYLSAYLEMFLRDTERLHQIYGRLNICPLGAGALAGTTYPLDRDMVAKELGFAAATGNSMDSVSDRDYLIELMSAFSIIMMHLSRFCEELILWNSNEYRFVEMDDAFSTGSSIMPQKKNPDIAELVRGKTGRVYGDLMGLLTTMKGLPLAYNKDMQEDKEGFFDASDTVEDCIQLFEGMLRTVTFKKDIMEKSAMMGFTNATDAADYLVKKGVAFRDAHGIIGSLVLYCIGKNCAIEDLSLAELKEISPVFEEDIYDAITLKTCVERRLTKGGPSKQAVEEAIARYEQCIGKGTGL